MCVYFFKWTQKNTGSTLDGLNWKAVIIVSVNLDNNKKKKDVMLVYASSITSIQTKLQKTFLITKQKCLCNQNVC